MTKYNKLWENNWFTDDEYTIIPFEKVKAIQQLREDAIKIILVGDGYHLNTSRSVLAQLEAYKRWMNNV